MKEIRETPPLGAQGQGKAVLANTLNRTTPRGPTSMECRWCGKTYRRGAWLPNRDSDHYCNSAHWLLATWGVRAARLLRLGGVQ